MEPWLTFICVSVSCVQAWYYFATYPKDPWYLKLLVCLFRQLFLPATASHSAGQVGAVFVSDSVHQILISHTRASCNTSTPPHSLSNYVILFWRLLSIIVYMHSMSAKLTMRIDQFISTSSPISRMLGSLAIWSGKYLL